MFIQVWGSDSKGAMWLRLTQVGGLAGLCFPPINWVCGPQGASHRRREVCGHRREGPGLALMPLPLHVPESVSVLLRLVWVSYPALGGAPQLLPPSEASWS